MIILTFTAADGETPVIASTEIPDVNGPALRSAIAEIRNELGERASGAHAFYKEDAIVRAINALGALASALNVVIPTEDPDYE